MHLHSPAANTTLDCVQEGRWHHWQCDRLWKEGRHPQSRNLPEYRSWQWSALKGLRQIMNEQASWDSKQEVDPPDMKFVEVWPAKARYCINLKGTDAFYDLRHEEVLGEAFNPKQILNQMIAIGTRTIGDRPQIYADTSLNRRQSIMMDAIKLMVGAS